jgi:hypothetical protein
MAAVALTVILVILLLQGRQNAANPVAMHVWSMSAVWERTAF